MENIPENIQERLLESFPEGLQKRFPERFPEGLLERLPERVPELPPEGLLVRLPEGLLEGVPEGHSEVLPGGLPERLLETSQRCLRMLWSITKISYSAKVLAGILRLTSSMQTHRTQFLSQQTMAEGLPRIS